MKKINHKVRVSEVADIAHRIVTLFKEETGLQKETFLKNLFAEMEKQVLNLSESIKKEIAVSRLEELDGLRDETIFNLHNILVGYRSMRSAEIKEKAEKLYVIFQRYGTATTRESYATASAHIEALLKDFSATELQETIEGLSGVSETIEELRTRQANFRTEQMAYEKALSLQQATASATTLKKPLLDLINTKLVSFFTATQDDAPYKNFAKVLNQVIDSLNESIARRAKNTAKGKTNPTETKESV